jgi:hypothetical protein
MKKIKTFFRNIIWLFNNELPKLSVKKDFIIKAEDLSKAEISGIATEWKHDSEGRKIITQFELHSVSTTFGESGNSFVKE